MSDEKKDETTETPASEEAAAQPSPEPETQDSAQDGPKFTKAPDPLAGVKKGAEDVMASMEGKTVSMKVYVGSIIGVVVLMLLARCGG
jgi:biotin carboxyl carrier protein